MLDTTIDNLGRPMAVLFIEERPQLVERDGETVAGPGRTRGEVISDATHQLRAVEQLHVTGISVLEAQDLALLLRAGSLAAPIVPIRERTIGPSLGATTSSAASTRC